MGRPIPPVELHVDPLAEASTRELGARAYTVGRHVVIAPAEFAPRTRRGQALIAHELAHAVQQAGARPAASSVEVMASDRLEMEAERAAAGRPGQLSQASSIMIQRAGGTGAPQSPPNWLAGIANPRHVQGNVWEIDIKGVGPHYVGPYAELEKFVGRQNLKTEVDVHHIVGAEHLELVPTGFTYDSAPAVALERGLHRKVLTSWIRREQRELGGRGPGRPAATTEEIREVYQNVYRVWTDFEELGTISKNVLARAPTGPVPGSGASVSTAPRAPATPPPRGALAVGGGRSAPGQAPTHAEDVRVRPRISIGDILEPGETRSLRGMGLRGAPSPVTGAAFNLGAQVASGLLTSWMHDKMLEAVERMPPPTIHQARLWQRGGVIGRTPIDLLGSRLKQVRSDFLENQQTYVGNMVVFSLTLGQASGATRAALLADAQRQVNAHVQALVQAALNLDDALKLEPAIRERIEAARSLQQMIESGPGLALLFHEGMSVEEIAQISSNLAWYQAAYRVDVLEPLHDLRNGIAEAIRSDQMVRLQLREASAQTAASR